MPTMTTLPPIGDWIDLAPWRTRAVSFLLVEEPYVHQAHDLADKRNLLERGTGPLLVLWHGRHYTSARGVTDAERASVLKRLS